MRKVMLLNITNHPSNKWSEEQMNGALNLALDVVDIPFPNVDPKLSTEEVYKMADNLVQDIEKKYGINNICCLVQGDFTLTVALIFCLNYHEIPVYAATSERNTINNEDGSKTFIFNFNQFRNYIYIPNNG